MPASSLVMADCASFLLRVPTNRFSLLEPCMPIQSRKFNISTSRRMKCRFSGSVRSFRMALANGRQRNEFKLACIANAIESFCNTELRSGKLPQDGVQIDTVLCSFAAENSEPVINSMHGVNLPCRWPLDMAAAVLSGLPLLMIFTDAAHAKSIGELDMIYAEIGAGLESSAQLLYLGALLGLVGIGSFFVVRQILIRRELESAAKVLQERVRTGEALAMEYFELGAVMLRKRFYGLAAKYLEQAVNKWDGDPQDLAQVHNALGFSFVNDDKVDKAIVEYEKAVKLQPGYVVAWNNLGNAYQKKKELPKALKAYEQALFFDPNNKVARDYRDTLKERVDRLEGVSVKSD